MSSRAERRLALLKVLAAAAWADGRIDPGEVAHLEGRMQTLGLDAAGMAKVHELLEHPVPYPRCEELTRELLSLLQTREEREEVLAEVEALLRADGVVDPEERELLDGLRGVMDSLETADSFMTRVTGVFRKMFASRPAGGGGAAEFLKNRVLARLDEVSGGAWSADVDAATLNRYTLFGAVLGRVAHAEDGIAEEELDRIRDLLARRFYLKDPLLAWTVQAVRESSSVDTGRQELLSEFNRIASMEERIQLLEACFSVAEADGSISPAELEELRLIANFLWIDPRRFHGIRSQFGAKV